MEVKEMLLNHFGIISLTGRKRSMWKSQDSERRLTDPIAGGRDLSDAVSSSPPPPNFAATVAPPVTRPGFARRILGGRGETEEFVGPVPAPAPVEPDPDILGLKIGFYSQYTPSFRFLKAYENQKLAISLFSSIYLTSSMILHQTFPCSFLFFK